MKPAFAIRVVTPHHMLAIRHARRSSARPSIRNVFDTPTSSTTSISKVLPRKNSSVTPQARPPIPHRFCASCRSGAPKIIISRANVTALEEKLLHTFHDRTIIVEAMVHASCQSHEVLVERLAQDGTIKLDLLPGKVTNERCEWIGDKVLGLYVSKLLYDMQPLRSEGELSALSNALLSRAHANEMCVALDHLDCHLVCSPLIEQIPGRVPSRFGNFLESCFGALYCDGGDIAVRRFFSAKVAPLLHEAIENNEGKRRDYKSRVHELLMQNGIETSHVRTVVSYQTDAIDAAAHPNDRTVNRTIYIYGMPVSYGSGLSRSDADQQASRRLLDKLHSEGVSSFLDNLRAVSKSNQITS